MHYQTNISYRTEACYKCRKLNQPLFNTTQSIFFVPIWTHTFTCFHGNLRHNIIKLLEIFQPENVVVVGVSNNHQFFVVHCVPDADDNVFYAGFSRLLRDRFGEFQILGRTSGDDYTNLRGFRPRVGSSGKGIVQYF